MAEDPPYEPYKPEFDPRTSVPYSLWIDGVETRGSTDGDGRIEVKLPPNAQEGPPDPESRHRR